MKRSRVLASLSIIVLSGFVGLTFLVAADPTTPQPAQPKADAPKAEAPKSDEPKAEPAKPEPAKVVPPKKAWQVLDTGKIPADARLKAPRKLDDKDHPWEPPQSQAEWEAEAKLIRERLLVSNGLWPMPPKLPLKPVIHGKIDRDDYTIEKVYFSTHPGHYVTGNLYRPKNISGKVPGVLCPHGHWDKGRFYDAGDEHAAGDIKAGGEKTNAGAHYPLQARMVQLARMGCIVFHYDMVGYADSQQIKHAAGFTDAEASLRLQNFMGLQTFNSLRALDFLTSLKEVDPKRIGVTGASGGGTQTFMLCALDQRPTAAFPAVMVSTAMQGGCVCENADYLRIGISNIAIAALFAPKPLGMSGANDWTIDIETKGLPELQDVYKYYDKPENVMAKCFPQFGHNYNRVSRELMYNWFNEHLKLGAKTPVEERDFTPVPPNELSVFNAEYPLPSDAQTSEQLRQYWTATSNEQYQKLLPENADQLREYRRVVGTAARIMLDRGVPDADEIQIDETTETIGDALKVTKGTIGRLTAGEQIPFVVLHPKKDRGKAVIWIDGKGKSHLFAADGKPTLAVSKLLEAGCAVISADVFQTGEYLPPGETVVPSAVDAKKYSGYTFGYNRPLLSNRVRDILTVIGGAVHQKEIKNLSLVGSGEAGPWVLLAAALADGSVKRAIADLNGFSFASLKSIDDPNFLPGAMRYGDIGGLTALAAPCRLVITGVKNPADSGLSATDKVYKAARGTFTMAGGTLQPALVVSELSGE